MNTHIKNILHSIFQKEDSWKTKLIQEWPTIIGNLSDKITLEKIEQTTLILGVAHPAWIQEFTSLTPLIITTINNHLEYPFVTNIRFKTKKSQKLIWQHAYTTQKKNSHSRTNKHRKKRSR